MTSYSQTDTFSISTIQSLILHSLLTSSHLNCFSFSPCSPDALHPPPPTHPRTTHTSIRQVLPTPVMTLQRQSSPALLSPPLHHSVHPRKTLRPYFSWSCSSASLSPTLSLSCFMAVDLLPEHLASRVREREDTHTHKQHTGSSWEIRTWEHDEERTVFEGASLLSCTFWVPGVLTALWRAVMTAAC